MMQTRRYIVADTVQAVVKTMKGNDPPPEEPLFFMTALADGLWLYGDFTP